MLRIAIVTPVFNDWASFQRLTEDISLTFQSTHCSIEFIAVDDCSTDDPPQNIPITAPVWRIQRLALISNLGHQRAIAIGLSTLAERPDIEIVAIMDSDGEDRPADLAQLIEAAQAHPQTIIAAQRAKRSEGNVFKAYYFAYKIIFAILTGQSIDFGNFCILSSRHAIILANKPETWNHFAAAVVRSRLPIKKVPTARGKRYTGQSKMNFVSLLVHGLGAMSVFSEAVLIRITLASGFALLLCLLGFVTITAIRFLTDLAIPGWATNVFGFLLLITIQAVILPLSMAFMLLNSRSSVQLAPREFAAKFIHKEHVISAV